MAGAADMRGLADANQSRYYNIPGLSAFCLQTRLSKESRLRRG